MKEQSEKLFRAIGDVGDDLIARADAPVKKAPRVWVKWAALAACCALVIGAAAFVVPMFHAGSSAPETASAPTADTAAPEAPAEEEMEMTLEASEAPAEAIDRFLRTLPERECSIFLRRYWYVDSVQDIAARYALRENTAKSILFRTREKLRRYLAGEGIVV